MIKSISEQLQLHSSTSFITGDSGAGKTSLVLQVEQNYSQPFRLVSFAAPIYSYKEFIKTLTLALQCEESNEQKGDNVQVLSSQCIDVLQERAGKLLIICDEAHSIYLATFERILRFQDELIQNGVGVHLIFTGKPLLTDILEQLAGNSSVRSEFVNINLSLLNKEECGTFFLDLVKRNNQNITIQTLSNDFLEQLYSVTKGNMKEIKKVADKADKKTQDDASFFSLLNKIDDTDNNKEKRKPIARVKGKKGSQNKSFILALVLLVLVVAGSAVLYFSKGGEQVTEGVEPIKAKQPAAVVSKPKPSVIEIAGIKETVEVAQKEAKAVEVAVQKTAEQVVAEVESIKTAVEKTNTTSPFKPFVPAISILSSPAKTNDDLGKVVKEESTQNQSDVVEEVEVTKVDEKIFDELVLEPQKKIEYAVSPSNKDISAEELYKSRAAATVKWLDKRDSDFYTMQLMALTSEKSKAHLLEFLNKDEYRTVADSFYILRKKQSPPTLYVFYGEYVSKDAASQAREKLPEFLKNHKPYLVSVDGAMKKAGL